MYLCSLQKRIFFEGLCSCGYHKNLNRGDALNEATVLARLKRPEQKTEAVYLLTVLGEDEAGGMIAARCREEGISMELAIRDADLETGINVVLVQEDGQRSFLRILKAPCVSLHGSIFLSGFLRMRGFLHGKYFRLARAWRKRTERNIPNGKGAEYDCLCRHDQV